MQQQKLDQHCVQCLYVAYVFQYDYSSVLVGVAFSYKYLVVDIRRGESIAAKLNKRQQ